GGADRLGDAENLAIQDVAGRFGRDVAGRNSRPADRHHQVHPTDHRGVERVADLDLVSGHRDHAVDHESRLGQQLGDQRTAVVLLVPVRGAVVDHHDQRPANYQLRTRIHGCNRITELGQWLIDSHHCSALPRVTWTVRLPPPGSWKVSETLSPGALDRTAATRASAELIGRSSTLVTTTPLGTPAPAAAPPCTTSTTLAPGVPLSLVTCTPSEACVALPVLINSSAMRLA